MIIVRLLKAASVALICLVTLYPGTASSKEFVTVSLVSLISTPEKYQGKLVRVNGYLHYRFEDNALYLSKDDGTYLIGKNSVWLHFSEDVKVQTSFNKGNPALTDLNDKYVLVEGRFNKNDKGHLGAHSGALNDVRRVLELKPYHTD